MLSKVFIILAITVNIGWAQAQTQCPRTLSSLERQIADHRKYIRDYPSIGADLRQRLRDANVRLHASVARRVQLSSSFEDYEQGIQDIQNQISSIRTNMRTYREGLDFSRSEIRRLENCRGDVLAQEQERRERREDVVARSLLTAPVCDSRPIFSPETYRFQIVLYDDISIGPGAAGVEVGNCTLVAKEVAHYQRNVTSGSGNERRAFNVRVTPQAPPPRYQFARTAEFIIENDPIFRSLHCRHSVYGPNSPENRIAHIREYINDRRDAAIMTTINAHPHCTEGVQVNNVGLQNSTEPTRIVDGRYLPTQEHVETRPVEHNVDEV